MFCLYYKHLVGSKSDSPIQVFFLNIHLMYGYIFVKQKHTATLWHKKTEIRILVYYKAYKKYI